jgi:hypothetical protein
MAANKKRTNAIFYSEELGVKFCEMISEGMSVREICTIPSMPDRKSFYRWRKLHPEFERQYCEATQNRAETFVDQMTDIAFNVVVNENGVRVSKPFMDNVAVMEARLKIDTLKWIACKLKPVQFGDKNLSVVDEGGQTIIKISRGGDDAPN